MTQSRMLIFVALVIGIANLADGVTDTTASALDVMKRAELDKNEPNKYMPGEPLYYKYDDVLCRQALTNFYGINERKMGLILAYDACLGWKQQLDKRGTNQDNVVGVTELTSILGNRQLRCLDRFRIQMLGKKGDVKFVRPPLGAIYKVAECLQAPPTYPGHDHDLLVSGVKSLGDLLYSKMEETCFHQLVADHFVAQLRWLELRYPHATKYGNKLYHKQFELFTHMSTRQGSSLSCHNPTYNGNGTIEHSIKQLVAMRTSSMDNCSAGLNLIAGYYQCQQDNQQQNAADEEEQKLIDRIKDYIDDCIDRTVDDWNRSSSSVRERQFRSLIDKRLSNWLEAFALLKRNWFHAGLTWKADIELADRMLVMLREHRLGDPLAHFELLYKDAKQARQVVRRALKIGGQGLMFNAHLWDTCKLLGGVRTRVNRLMSEAQTGPRQYRYVNVKRNIPLIWLIVSLRPQLFRSQLEHMQRTMSANRKLAYSVLMCNALGLAQIDQTKGEILLDANYDRFARGWLMDEPWKTRARPSTTDEKQRLTS